MLQQTQQVAQTLRRVLLYVISISFLIFVAYMFGRLLYDVFQGSEQASFGGDLVLFVLAFGVSWLMGGGRPWGTYARIRSEIKSDPAAAHGPVPAIALNLVQGLAAVVALTTGIYGWSLLVSSTHPLELPVAGIKGGAFAGPLAIALAATAVFVVVQLWRNYQSPDDGTPIGAQRTHIYLVLSFALVVSCIILSSGANAAGLETLQPQIWVSMLWAMGTVVLYGLLARGDTTSRRRLVAQLFGFELGLIWSILGLRLVGHSLLVGSGNQILTSGSLSFLVFGLVVMGGYGIWLVSEASQNRLGRQRTVLTMEALATFTLGVAFYLRLILLGSSLLLGSHENNWAAAIELAFLGLLYIPLAFWLGHQTRQIQTRQVQGREVRMAYELGGQGAGLVSSGIAAVWVLYSLIGHRGILTNAGYAIADAWTAFWQCEQPHACSSALAQQFAPIAITALVVMVVGIFVAILHYYGWGTHRLRPSNWLRAWRRRSPDPNTAGDDDASDEDSSITAIVAGVASGSISKERAIMRLQQLVASQQ
jgi:hypothetical protein